MTPEAFDEYPLWNTIERVEGALRQVEALGDAMPSHRMDEVRELLAHTLVVKDTGEKPLFSTGMLEAAARAWGDVASNLEAFLSSPSSYAKYLDAAVLSLDGVRDAIALFPKPTTTSAFRSSISRGLAKYLELLSSSREMLATQLKEAEDAASAREVEHATTLEALSADQEVLRSSLVEMEGRVAASLSRFDTAFITQSDSFVAAQTGRESVFKEWLLAQEAEFAELASPYLEDVHSAARDASLALDEVKGLRTNVVEMSAIVAGDNPVG